VVSHILPCNRGKLPLHSQLPQCEIPPVVCAVTSHSNLTTLLTATSIRGTPMNFICRIYCSDGHSCPVVTDISHPHTAVPTEVVITPAIDTVTSTHTSVGSRTTDISIVLGTISSLQCRCSILQSTTALSGGNFAHNIHNCSV